ncbi:S41 family peptidase [Afifella pfennigii]|uniref:S41 family peptidase n=1 Tax=Afifella pfennigii TaxID=209897 RepID=UPI000556AE0B|nr:S41 family peptidase [Afifella pfennigii]
MISFRFLPLFLLALASPGLAQDRAALFNEAAAIVEEQFFDPSMNGLDWAKVSAEHRARLTPHMEPSAFADEVNAMLARLQASHTRLYTRDMPAWYQLAGVFMPASPRLAEELAPFLQDGAPSYVGIGAFTESDGEAHVVTGVLEGLPAAEAGLLLGDRILSVGGEPFHPILSWEGRAEERLALEVERRPGETRTLTVTPRLLDGRTMFKQAMRASARLIERQGRDRQGRRIGYIRAWSYAGGDYQDILAGEALYGSLKEAEALVLDLRGGWGGANPQYLQLFAERAVETTSLARDGSAFTFASAWTKPVVLLVDEGSRSGKELIAHGFRALRIGPIVGERTAGAVLAGTLNVLSDGSLLYVAVSDVRVDGERLEGVGVAPDIEVPFEPLHAAGADPQLERALAEALALAES